MGFTSVAISVNCFITDALQNSNFFPKCPETGITVIELILLLFLLIELILNTTREISIYSFSRSKTTHFSYLYKTGENYLKDKGVCNIDYRYLTLSLSIAVLMYTPN